MKKIKFLVYFIRHIPQVGEVQTIATNLPPDDKVARKLYFKKRSTSSACAVS